MAGDYEVGYKKPPKHTQFSKGRSGNPRGRPKGTKNLKTDLLEELGELILVREGPRELRVSKQRAMVKNLMAKAVKGDARAATIVLNMVYRLLEVDGGDVPDTPLSDDERAILENFEESILRKAQPRDAQDRTLMKPDPE